MLRAVVLTLAVVCFTVPASARLLGLDDLQREQSVGSPELSPDGEWVAYTVGGFDEKIGKRVSQLWKVSWDGRRRLRLTQGPYDVSAVRWSPDGKYLSFLSARSDDDAAAQVWVLDSAGGEARALTDVKDGVATHIWSPTYAWSPDSKRLALVIQPRKPGREQGAQPKPIVIDRYQFKSDSGRYHDGDTKQARIHLYDLASKSLTPLTAGDQGFAESAPAWSPDGRQIAFVSNRDADWDRGNNTDVWVVEAHGGAVPRRVTNFPGQEYGPVAWSPDGKLLAYVRGQEIKYWLYHFKQVAVIPAQGGEPVLLTRALDRDTTAPRFSEDGRYVEFLIADSRARHLGRVPVKGGVVRRVIDGERVVGSDWRGMNGYSTVKRRTAVVAGTSDTPMEIYAWDQDKPRALTNHNGPWLAGVKLGETRGFEYPAADGVEVHGLLTLPPNASPGMRHPLILWIHGGPYLQDSHSFNLQTQLFAAHGYAVARINYRGSAGRGLAFSRGIVADWGNRDRMDLMAGVDYLIAQGIADPDRLGVGGTSQGGILTNYVIARDTRFKAAISGAGAGNHIGMYGTDQYVIRHENEFGRPWENPQRYLALSYPFFEADKITTPTLYVHGLDDFNVPVIGGEQMYQALKSLGVPTRLVIYPGEKHDFIKPYFIRDRMERYLAWYDNYLKPAQ